MSKLAVVIVSLFLLVVGVFLGSFLTVKGLLTVKTDSGAVRVNYNGSMISLSPSKIYLDNIPLGYTTEQCIYIANNSSKDIELPLNIFCQSDNNEYQAINSQWVRLDNNIVSIAAKSRIKVPVYIDMPQRVNSKAFEFMISPNNIEQSIKVFINVQ
ncbi:MAG: hypothetical protein PHQ22_10680 [Sulfuricurvum sp.]|nr:hypothetical protein [Sulfuricurvum sp.]